MHDAHLILSCRKTGEWWKVRNTSEAMRLARTKGLVDFEIGEAQ
ncbi:hypothetical protein TRICHSKD4_1056 [Roseibium sp. TrichSKD4]|nr:hypothetical protein [Roseibium sp. TrichSKD4]EFO33937.1 hypothetical protein TRICHSKD4_1056 [Roseibium sp. TrichSKD4]